jgi:NADPH:quinone reductase-like Zn-dependent oxidoreductase
MKAIVYYRYGSPDVLQHREVDDPVVPDGSVLVRVRASSVNPHDSHFMRGEPHVIRLIAGLRAPRRNGLGIDVCGVVEAVGRDVTRIRPGDEVFGTGRAAFAEYTSTPETNLALKTGQPCV